MTRLAGSIMMYAEQHVLGKSYDGCGWDLSGIMCAFPCTTWSRARHPPLRTNAFLFGKPGMRDHEEEQVRIGNLTSALASRMVKAAIAVRIPIVCENPVASMAWRASPMSELRVQAGMEASTDLCKFSCR